MMKNAILICLTFLLMLAPAYGQFKHRKGKRVPKNAVARTLPIEVGLHSGLPRCRRVRHVCRSGASCDERHVLLECPALGDIRAAFPGLTAECSGVMAKVVWAKDQPLISKYIIACLDRAEACWYNRTKRSRA